VADAFIGLGDIKIRVYDNGDGTHSFATATATGTGGGSGGVIVAIKTAAVVQAAAYSQNDLVGGKLTFTNAMRTSGGSGILRGFVMGDQAANGSSVTYDLILFDADPTGTTFTENGPLDIADADLNKIIGVLRLNGTGSVGDYIAMVDNAVLVGRVEQPLKASGSANLYGALIVRSATVPTYAATSDVFLTLLIEQN